MIRQALTVSGLVDVPVWVRWLVAGLLACLFFAGQVFGLFAVGRGSFIDDSKLRLRSAGAQETGMGLEQVAALHLFGDVSANIVAPPPVTELPKTDLKLVLVGAMTDSDPQKASALIAADNQSRRYFIGDNIPGGAILHEVLPDSVVLKRDNRYETLLFPRTSDVPASGALRRGAGVQLGGGAVPAANTAGHSLRERLAPKPYAGRE